VLVSVIFTEMVMMLISLILLPYLLELLMRPGDRNIHIIRPASLS
jgi:hypothetical protein